MGKPRIGCYRGGDQRYPGLTRLLQKLAAGISFDGWFGQRREKLLINPLSNPPKIRRRETKAELVATSTSAGVWEIKKIEFPKMKSLGKMSHGLVGQTTKGVTAEFFASYLAKAGYTPLIGGLFLPSPEKMASSSVQMESREFQHRLSIRGWDIALAGQIGAADLGQALGWFVQYGLKDSGVQSMDGLLKQASDYVRLVGLDPARVDHVALRHAFERVRPVRLSRAALSRALYPLYFGS